MAWEFYFGFFFIFLSCCLDFSLAWRVDEAALFLFGSSLGPGLDRRMPFTYEDQEMNYEFSDYNMKIQVTNK